VLANLGRPGALLQRALRRVVTTAAAYDWSEIQRIEPMAITLVLGSTGIAARRASGRRPGGPGRRYTMLARLPVVDAVGESWRVMDARVALQGRGSEPRLLGLIVDTGNVLHHAGLKRSDSVSLPLLPLGCSARFAPVEQLGFEERRIVVHGAFSELSPVGDAPDPTPPPPPGGAA
jgi:hypothetical protein